MKVKKVNRYYCEFCKKSGYSASHMSKHERHCTLNPARKCRMCAVANKNQANLRSLIELLPDPTGMTYGSENSIEHALYALRKASDNCPACIMAALRQRGIPLHAVDDFNFTAECKEFWAIYNEAQAQQELIDNRQGYSYFY